MTRPRRISKKRVGIFTKKVYGASVMAFFLVACFVLLSAFNQNQDIRQFAQTASTQNANCSEFSRSWGEWCVYTFTDATPDPVLPALKNVSFASAWQRDSAWNLIVSGRQESQPTQYAEAVFLFQSSDDFGLTDWEQVQGAGINGSIFDETVDTVESAQLSGVRSSNWNANNIIISQPSVIPVEQLPAKEDGSPQDCCDTITYSFSYSDDETRQFMAIHQTSILPWDMAQLRPAGQFGQRNPIFSKKAYRDVGVEEVLSVRDGRVLFDERTSQFYMVYVEQLEGATSQVSLAQSPWPNLTFSLSTRGILAESAAAQPQIVIGGDGSYYLFYTRPGQQNEIWVAEAQSIAGPYVASRPVLQAQEGTGVQSVSAPYVFCNSQIDQWQMYFVGKTDQDTQLYTAFLGNSCDQAPVL